jgi:predicted SAM-dependent methyltransferase
VVGGVGVGGEGRVLMRPPRNRALLRINAGCGQTPTPGWLNVDNSLSVLLAKWRPLSSFVAALGFLGKDQRAFIEVARAHGIVWANAMRLPVGDECAEVVYASHLLEHLDRTEAQQFLQEVKRVLVKGGWLRLAVPDLKKIVDEYLRDKDADTFVTRTHLARPRPKNWAERLRYLIIGDRHHFWMYDAASLKRVLEEAGFVEVEILQPGKTGIPDPGPLNLYERAEESIFAEARKP